MEEIQKNELMEPLDIPEEDIPWYRMRWFFLVTFLIFYPATLIIGLSGNIYGKQKGVTFKLANKFKYLTLFVGLGLTVSIIIRNF